VTNNNSTYPNNAPGVVLTDTLGANLIFVSATTSQGTFTQSGGVVTFSLGTVNYSPTATITATVTAQATEDGNLSDSASVTYANDPVTTNNTASPTSTVSEPPIVPPSSQIIVTGKRVNNITTATFTHASGVEPASAFIATIDWGDGHTSNGTITESGTTYTVKGSHRYNSGSSHTVTTTVTEAGSSPNLLSPESAVSSVSGAISTIVVNPQAAVPLIRQTSGLPTALHQSELDLPNLRQAPLLVPQATTTIQPAVSPASGRFDLSSSTTSSNSAGVLTGIAILDLYPSLPAQQGSDLQSTGLKLVGSVKPRSAWFR
jgi:hypothetical protein